MLRAGPLSLIQDLGRYGQLSKGMSPGGPLDEHAFLWANKLLSNGVSSSQLEITLGPCKLLAQAPTQFALCGADMSARLDGRPIQNWSSHFIQAGQELHLNMARQGLRAYLAVKDGFKTPLVYGSSATVIREALGGLNAQGRALQDGDTLCFQACEEQSKRSVPHAYRPNYCEELELRLIASYQYHQFSEKQKRTLFESSFKIHSQSDRMGYRLQGNRITPPSDGLISEGIAFGAVQVPPDGQAIILLKDRQSIGGYPKLGCIASQDAFALSQRRPGQMVRFRLASASELCLERRKFLQFFSR